MFPAGKTLIDIYIYEHILPRTMYVGDEMSIHNSSFESF